MACLQVSQTPECRGSSFRFLLMSEENRQHRQHRHLTLLLWPFMASRLTLCFMFRAIKHNVDITVKYLPMETGCFAAVDASAEPRVSVQSLHQTHHNTRLDKYQHVILPIAMHSLTMHPARGMNFNTGSLFFRSSSLSFFLSVFLAGHRRQTGPGPCVCVCCFLLGEETN